MRKAVWLIYTAWLGILAGWWLRENAEQITYRHAAAHRRCDYNFPWSGQCKGWNGHKGEHY